MKVGDCISTMRPFATCLGALVLVAVTAACASPMTDGGEPNTVVRRVGHHPSMSSSSETPTKQRLPLRPGDTGKKVLELQQRLTALGYWLGVPDGRYGFLTQQAVVALQKASVDVFEAVPLSRLTP